MLGQRSTARLPQSPGLAPHIFCGAHAVALPFGWHHRLHVVFAPHGPPFADTLVDVLLIACSVLQTNDLPTQLHYSLFELNGGRGYVRKPAEILGLLPATLATQHSSPAAAKVEGSSDVEIIAKRPASGFDAKGNEDLIVVSSKPPSSRDSADATLTGSLVLHTSGPVPKRKSVLPFDDTMGGGANEAKVSVDGRSSMTEEDRTCVEQFVLQAISVHQLPAPRGEERPRHDRGSHAQCHQYTSLSGSPAAIHVSPRLSSPLVVVELHSIHGYSSVATSLPKEMRPTSTRSQQTPPAAHGGLCARFQHQFICLASHPMQTLLRVLIRDQGQDVAYETAVLGALRSGYRSFQLRRCGTGTRISLCSLLLHIQFVGPAVLERDRSEQMRPYMAAHSAAQRLQEMFRRRKQKSRRRNGWAPALLDLSVRLELARIRSKRVGRLIAGVWVCLGMVFFGTGVSLLGSGVAVEGALLPVTICSGSLLCLMALQPTDRHVKIARALLLPMLLVAVVLAAMGVVGDGFRCYGFERTAGPERWRRSCETKIFYACLCVACATSFLCLRRACSGPVTSSRRQLVSLWGAARLLWVLVDVALLVRVLLTLLLDYPSSPAEWRVLWMDVSDMLVVGTSVVTFAQSRRAKAQKMLRRIIFHPEDCTAMYIAACVGDSHTTRRKLLKQAHGFFPALPSGSLREADFLWSAATRSSLLGAQTTVATYGKVDAYVSHCWKDAPHARFAALKQWTGDLTSRTGIAPLIWIDWACGVLEDEIANLPIALVGCMRLVCLVGPSYVKSLWSMMEIFTWLQLGRPASLITMVPLDSGDVGGCHICAALAHCLENQHTELMRSQVEASFGSLAVLDEQVSAVFGDRWPGGWPLTGCMRPAQLKDKRPSVRLGLRQNCTHPSPASTLHHPSSSSRASYMGV